MQPLAGDAAGEDLPLPPARPEAARNEHAVDLLELAARLLDGHALGVHPAHLDETAVVDPRVLERLVHGQIGVVELDVLADERDLDGVLALGDALCQLRPHREVGFTVAESELAADELVEPLRLQRLRDEVDVSDVLVRDHRVDVDVGEERDLVADVGGQRVARAADDDVRMDADAAQLVHRVLRRLRLQLAGRVDERHERDVEVEHVLGPGLAADLTDRLQEGQRLDVADSAADLRDEDVAVRRLAGAAHPVLDLVRDVRDHLHGRSQVLATALLADDRVPDGAGGVVRRGAQVLVEEPLVVADVEIGLGAVLGDEDLTVLERAHRARVDVDVRIELQDADLEAARLQHRAQRGSSDALAERRDDAARDEDVLDRTVAHRPSPVSSKRGVGWAALEKKTAGARPMPTELQGTTARSSAVPEQRTITRPILGTLQDGAPQSVAAVWQSACRRASA